MFGICITLACISYIPIYKDKPVWHLHRTTLACQWISYIRFSQPSFPELSVSPCGSHSSDRAFQARAVAGFSIRESQDSPKVQKNRILRFGPGSVEKDPFCRTCCRFLPGTVLIPESPRSIPDPVRPDRPGRRPIPGTPRWCCGAQ